MPADRDGPRGRRPSNLDLHFKKMRRRVQRPPFLIFITGLIFITVLLIIIDDFTILLIVIFMNTLTVQFTILGLC